MINVLIIEDDPMVREINSKFLNKLNEFNLSKAVAGTSEAKEFMNDNKVDLILLDVYLPKENGMDFLKWLRKKEIGVDVILITADKTSFVIQEAFRYGAVDYLIKPFTFERFKESLIKYKERYHNIKNLAVIEQKLLDDLRNGTNKKVNDNMEDNLVKGINQYTYKIIWKEVIKFGEDYMTAEEISERSGVARVTVRKYFEHMEKEGKLVKKIEYGKVGRPHHKYRTIKNESK